MMGGDALSVQNRFDGVCCCDDFLRAYWTDCKIFYYQSQYSNVRNLYT